MIGTHCNLDYIKHLELEKYEYKKLYFTAKYQSPQQSAAKYKLDEVKEHMSRYKRMGNIWYKTP